MMILDIASMCSDSALAVILPIARRILTFIQIIGPLLCIISLTISFINLMMNPDEKKEPGKIKNKIIALVLLFFVPTIVNAVMGILDDSTEFSRCWRYGGTNVVNNGNSNNNGKSSITTDPNKTRVSPIINPDDYKNTGTHHSEGDNNNSNSSSSSSTQTSAKLIIIGDSRMAQTYGYLSNDWNGANYSAGGVKEADGTKFVAETSMGLDWLKSTGISAAQPYFKSGTAVVISLGVNDLGNVDNYVSYVNSNAGTWAKNGSKIYFTTVNPCNGDYSYLNDQISNFNSKLKSGLSSSVRIIDTYSYVVGKGYSTTDGLHYSKETADLIYNYIKSNV